MGRFIRFMREEEWRAMSHFPRNGRATLRWILELFTILSWTALGSPCLRAEQPTASANSAATQVLTREAAIWRALQDNPELATLRQQHGIAAAAVVIAETYPFNPTWTNKVFADNGPESAGITNRVAMEQRVEIDIELRGQRTHRRQAASAGLSRADFEIAFSELGLAVRTARAFDAVLYRREKLTLAEDTVKLTKEAADNADKLRDRTPSGPADAILARTEEFDARAQTGQARGSYVASLAQLNTALGVTVESFELRGTLEAPAGVYDVEALARQALDARPDVHARQAAVGEAEARLRLEIANRYGNPKLGPDYEYNETRVNFIGFELVMPLPIFNTRRGEILQRQAERDRAILALRQNETQVRQEVQAAVRRLQEAEQWVETYRTKVLPNLRSSLETMENLFEKNLPGADALKVINIRRKLLTARGGYLDALWEASQARADLAAAVGDPAWTVNAEKPSPKP
jgi:cobalt-zinc-cadmium efflux system outer membrane protein